MLYEGYPESNLRFGIKKTQVKGNIFYYIRGLLEKYLTFGQEKETGLLGALDT